MAASIFIQAYNNMIERVTGAHATISTDHAMIHEKKAFSVSHFMSLAAAAVGYIEIIVPAGLYVHFKPANYQSDGPKILIELYKEPVITTGSSVLIPQNRNHVGTPPSSEVIIKTNPTGISGGTLMERDYLGGGTSVGQSGTGGNASNDNELVLKQSATYVVKVTNNGSGTSSVNVKLFWYEEDEA